jgi:tetratricopeptide (TPR) repeat protein
MINVLKADQHSGFSKWYRQHLIDNVAQGNYLLCDYLNSISILKAYIEDKRLEVYTKLKNEKYRPEYRESHEQGLIQVNEQAELAQKIAATIPATIIPLFRQLIANCPHREKYNLAMSYHKGLVSFMEGDAAESLQEINHFIHEAEAHGLTNLISSELLQNQGESYFEVGQYHEAIDALTRAILMDPGNSQAYLQRASAYFETADFRKSLDDYLKAKKGVPFTLYKLPPNEFIDAFSEAAIGGSREAICDLAPNLCHSIYGLGQCLWAVGDHPVESMKYLASAGYDVGEAVYEYFQTLDQDKLNEYADELVIFFKDFQQLSLQEKGKLIGYTVGKYGVDIFAGCGSLKTISAFKRLRDANRFCTLESMASSLSSEEKIITKTAEKFVERKQFFQTKTIEIDKQSKHIVGSKFYKEGNSIFEHPDPESLLKKHAGTGLHKSGEMGQPGYKELVDFGEQIGIWKNSLESKPTTKGIIHYSKQGAHIVPARPNEMSL